MKMGVSVKEYVCYASGQSDFDLEQSLIDVEYIVADAADPIKGEIYV